MSVVAILVLGAMEIAAMCTGHDGALFLPVAAIIGGIAGFKVGGITNGSKEKNRP